jgi:hypothetical protein
MPDSRRCRREALAAWLTRFDEAHPVDLLIANAGISIDKDNSSLDDFSIIRKTFASMSAACSTPSSR